MSLFHGEEYGKKLYTTTMPLKANIDVCYHRLSVSETQNISFDIYLCIYENSTEIL